MRYSRRLLLALGTAAVLRAAPAPAADLAPWVGTWFKLAGEANGVEFMASRTHRFGGRVTGWLHVTGWNDSLQELAGSVYFRDEESGWQAMTIGCHHFAGTTQDSVCWSDDSVGDRTLSLLVRLSGTVAGTSITKGTLRVLSGALRQREVVGGQEEASAAGLSLTGKRVDEGRVPDAVKTLVQ